MTQCVSCFCNRITEIVFQSAFCYCNKYGKERFVLTQTFGVLVLINWLCCFGACSKVAYHNRQYLVEHNYSPHGQKGRGWSLHLYSGSTFSDLKTIH